METGGEEQVQSRGGEKRESQEEKERERESPCVAHQRPPRINPLSRLPHIVFDQNTFFQSLKPKSTGHIHLLLGI